VALLVSQTYDSVLNLFIITDTGELYPEISIHNYSIQVEKFRFFTSQKLFQSDYVIFLLFNKNTFQDDKRFLTTFLQIVHQCDPETHLLLFVPESLNVKNKRTIDTLQKTLVNHKHSLKIKFFQTSGSISVSEVLQQHFPQIPWKRNLVQPSPLFSSLNQSSWGVFLSLLVCLPGQFIYGVLFLSFIITLLSSCQLYFLNQHQLKITSVCTQATEASLNWLSFFSENINSLAVINKPINFSRQITFTNKNILDYLSVASKTKIGQPLFVTSNPFPQIAPLVDYQKRLFHNLQDTRPDLEKLLLQKDAAFLLVVMDHNEIRPSGGTPLSFVVINVRENAPFRYKIIEPSYAEFLSHGDLPTPDLLSSLIKQDSYSVYSASWDPDLSATTETLLRLLKEQFKDPPDAVVYADQKTISSLLSLTGPIILSDKNLSINTKNLDSILIESYSSGRAFSEKLISSLLKNLIPKLFSLSPYQQKSLTQKLYDLVDSRNLSLTLLDQSTFSAEKLGWTNKISVPFCSSVLPCLSNYFYISEFTLNDLKTDRFVSRRFDLQSTIDLRRLSSDYLLIYQNQSPFGYPYGSAEKYLRLFLPSDVILDGLLVDNNPQHSDDYDQEMLYGLKVVSFKISTPPSGETSIRLIFHQIVSVPQYFLYQMNFPVSPGTSPSVSYTVKFPPYWQAVVDGSPSVASPSLIRYNTQTYKPLNIKINFTQTKE
jgi:hypothetical protein